MILDILTQKEVTTGGVVVYEDKFSFSHHGTDPASSILCNAFDLVRIHKFGHLDEDAKPDTPANRLPSFTKMSEFASSNEKVILTLGKEGIEKSQEDFDIIDINETVETEWTKNLSYSKKGELLATSKNFRIIIENHPLLKGKIVLDEFNIKHKVLGSLPWDKEFQKERDWVDTDDAGLREFLETYYINAPRNKYEDAISLVFKNNSFHPVKDYFNSLVWDGENRIEALLIDYFGAEDTEYTRFVMKKWLVAGVARIYNPGTKFDYVPILSGPGGIGKSTFFKKLGKNDWFTDSLNKFDDDKNVIEIMAGKFIAEFGELAGMKKTEVNIIKAFITKTEFNARLAYERRVTRRLIQWLYCGTTNDKEFLKDKTGNRRFWPVDVYKGEHQKNVFIHLDTEVDQIWAEAIQLYRDNYPVYPNKKEEDLAEEQQGAHMINDSKEGLIREFFEIPLPDGWEKLNIIARRNYIQGDSFESENRKCLKRNRICAMEVWCELYGKDRVDISEYNARDINEILSNIKGWKKFDKPKNFGKYYGTQRGFYRDVQ
jgi:predicted P-loop ATPase